MVVEYAAEQLRNVAVVGHGGAGKTSLVERLLYTAGVTKRVGRIEDGSTVSDWDGEEIRRQISIQTALIPLEWNGVKVNFLDAPGYFDFVGEVKASLRVVEGALLVVCAASGVEVGTEQAWQYARERDVPRLLFMNKLDRDNANFRQSLAQLREHFGNGVVPIYLPMGEADEFRGIIDLIRLQAYPTGGETGEPIPPPWQEDAAQWREALIEAVAATDDALTMKYLNDEQLSPEEVENALRNAVKTGNLAPVLVGSAEQGVGMRQLLRAVQNFIPSPGETGPVVGYAKDGQPVSVTLDSSPTALVFKTIADPYVGRLTLFRVYAGALRSDSVVHNASKGTDERLGQLFLLRGKEQIPVQQVGPGDMGAVAKLQQTTTGDTLCASSQSVILEPIEFPKPALQLALKPRNKGDEEKISSGLARLVEDDPALLMVKDSETGETLIAGTGETHLEVMTSRLEKKFGVQVELTSPRIPYRETLRGRVKVEGKHKKQSGGRGQYGHVWLELEPLPPGQGFEFVDKIFGGSVPRQYIPAVEKGIQETMGEGVLAGYPIVDVRATLYDGSYHSVDSSEMAFKIAASIAFKKGFMEAQPTLLEPVLNVEIVVPEAFMGDVIGDLNKKRGKIVGMEPEDGRQRIRAQVPMAEMVRYATDLRSMTQGRGAFTSRFSHYEELPAPLAAHVIDASGKNKAS